MDLLRSERLILVVVVATEPVDGARQEETLDDFPFPLLSASLAFQASHQLLD